MGKQLLNGSGFSFQQKLVGNESVTKLYEQSFHLSSPIYVQDCTHLQILRFLVFLVKIVIFVVQLQLFVIFPGHVSSFTKPLFNLSQSSFPMELKFAKKKCEPHKPTVEINSSVINFRLKCVYLLASTK